MTTCDGQNKSVGESLVLRITINNTGTGAVPSGSKCHIEVLSGSSILMRAIATLPEIPAGGGTQFAGNIGTITGEVAGLSLDVRCVLTVDGDILADETCYGILSVSSAMNPEFQSIEVL